MSDKHLRRQSHSINTGVSGISVRWYETPKGIKIFPRVQNKYPPTITPFVIPWRALRYALNRKDKL